MSVRTFTLWGARYGDGIGLVQITSGTAVHCRREAARRGAWDDLRTLPEGVQAVGSRCVCSQVRNLAEGAHLRSCPAHPAERDAGRCVDCFTTAHGWTPDMGDDAASFRPGVCAGCGSDGVVFVLAV